MNRQEWLKQEVNSSFIQSYELEFHFWGFTIYEGCQSMDISIDREEIEIKDTRGGFNITKSNMIKLLEIAEQYKNMEE